MLEVSDHPPRCCRYCAYLYFQLGTHRAETPGSPVAGGGTVVEGADSDEEDKDAETPSLSLAGATFMLTSITVIVAFSSECVLNDC